MAPKPEPARLVFRDGSCGTGDHPSDHDAQFGRAELVTDVPSSTFAFVLRRSTSFWTPDARRHIRATSAASVALRSRKRAVQLASVNCGIIGVP